MCFARKAAMNIRIAGFGGQGIVLAGYVLGHAGILNGDNALQTQSYGSESRGGVCKSDVVISEEEILELAPAALDVLVVLSQPALDKYLPNLKEDGVLIYDSDLVKPGRGGPRTCGLPATAIAHQTFGHDVVANMIMLGYLIGVAGVVDRESVRRAIAESVPPKTVDMNIAGFEEGLQRGSASVKHGA
jgi:2-oxoglutarate ferredoxin oxidoreductase subunit gamma